MSSNPAIGSALAAALDSFGATAGAVNSRAGEHEELLELVRCGRELLHVGRTRIIFIPDPGVNDVTGASEPSS